MTNAEVPSEQKHILQHVDSMVSNMDKNTKAMKSNCPEVLNEKEFSVKNAEIINTFTTSQKITLASLAMADFFCFCSLSIMAPFFPKEATEKGMTVTMSGFVFSFYALVMFVSSPYLGKILPKVGVRRMLLAGILVTGCCNVLFGILAFVDDYNTFTIFCFIIRGFEALGASAFTTAIFVFVLNQFPNNIGTVFGILETCIGLGLSTGPPIGGFLYTIGGFFLPFFAVGVAMILIVPLMVWLLPVVKDTGVLNKSTSILELLKVPAVFVTSITVLVVASIWSFLDPTLERHLSQFNLTAAQVGLVFLLFSGVYCVSNAICGWMADKFGNCWPMMVAGLFLSSIGFLLLGPCPFIPGIPNGLWVNYVSLIILGIANALALIPTFHGILLSAVDGGCPNSLTTYSLVAGIWSSSFSLGSVIAPVLMGGVLVQNYGFAMASTTMAAITFCVGTIVLIFFALKSKLDKHKHFTDDFKSGMDLSCKSTKQNSESTPLLISSVSPSYKMYSEER